MARIKIYAMKKTILLFFLLVSISITTRAQEVTKDSQPKKESLNNVLKLNPFSTILGFTQITYERNISENRNIELGLGLIGLGYDFFRVESKGINIRAGYKFMLSKNSNNIFKGFYVKPEIFFASYNKRFDTVPFLSGLEFHYMGSWEPSPEVKEKGYYRTMNTLSLFANIGYQWVLWKRVTIDWNFGLGVNFCKPVPNQEGFLNFSEGYMYGIFTNDEQAIFGAISSSLKIGFIF